MPVTIGASKVLKLTTLNKKNVWLHTEDNFLTSEQQAKKCLTMNSYNLFSLPLK